MHKVVIEAGEQSKNMQVLSNVLEQLAAAGLTRTDVVLTLGGGVVVGTDVTGGCGAIVGTVV